MRRILEVRTIGSFYSDNEVATDTFPASATRLIEVSAESGSGRPKNFSDALFKAD